MIEEKEGFCLGVDIGGTFTDAYLVSLRHGESFQAKVPTTPDDLIRGITDGVKELARVSGMTTQYILEKCVKFVHATTQSTNLVFTRTGARVGLVTTAGFEDTLTIMRAIGRVAGLSIVERQHYSQTHKPEQLVPARLIEQVSERVDYAGRVLAPLEEVEAVAKIKSLLEKEVESIAICLLWSFKNPSHERMLERVARKLAPDMFVSTSSDNFGTMGEYERTATTVLNAYVGPLMTEYLKSLEASLAKLGLQCPVLIATSQGGVLDSNSVLGVPVTTIESGPASGVVGSKYVAELIGVRNVIVTDVGGTTFKVGVIEDGTPKTTQISTITQFSINNPMLEIYSIGSGGGSLAWLDGGARLRVGPKSAQADPGPACYGRGGTEPTVTDADVVLGFINPEGILGGRMKIDRSLAERAIKEKIADRIFGGDVVLAAAGIREIVDNQMADLIRKGTLERGIDVRQFSLMAYGGAGPTHAGQYSRDLPVKEIIVPYYATVHSALGAVVSDVVHLRESSNPMVMSRAEGIPPGTEEKISEYFRDLEEESLAELKGEGFASDNIEFRRFLYLKYGRQVHTLLIPMGEDEGLGTVLERFERVYEQKYSKESVFREAGVELVSLRLESVGKLLVPKLRPGAEEHLNVEEYETEKRRVYWNRESPYSSSPGFEETPVYSGTKLPAGAEILGPAIIEHYGTTIVVHHDQRARVDRYLNTIITRNHRH